MNDTDRKDLARVLLRAASQALQCEKPEDFLTLRQGTFREINRIWVGITSYREATDLGNTMRILNGQVSATLFAQVAAAEASRMLAEVRATFLAMPTTETT